MSVRIYTDGACKNNVGAWGFIVLGKKQIEIKSDIKENATCNNEMELLAVQRALEYIIQKGYLRTTICTDSAYVLTGLTKLEEWKENSWRNSRGKKIKNVEAWESLCKTLDEVNKKIDWVLIEKTKAHSGNAFNEKIDKVVKRELKKYFGGKHDAKIRRIC